MAKIPARFRRVAEAFDDVARARLCESSGSEHSPENSLDLSDLVESFLERESGGRERGDNGEVVDLENEPRQSEPGNKYWSDSESIETLRGLLFDGECDEVRGNIRAEVEEACGVVGNGSSTSSMGFKRRLMSRLRERGFDAGLCKSKWERNGRIPSGSYDYVDVNVAGNRYIIEVFLAGEFQIARPTASYSSLLETFPQIFVGKIEELKQVVRLMCNEIKGSMKSVDMHVPPWRRHMYMQAKWFGGYKRTVNEVPVKKNLDSDKGTGKKRWVGFEPLLDQRFSYGCREDFGRKVGVKVGKLAMEFSGTN